MENFAPNRMRAYGLDYETLSGFNFLTGWPDREPIGPFGTITDSLSPRFAASALGAALLYRHRTGRGMHLDISQVETGESVYERNGFRLSAAPSTFRRATPCSANRRMMCSRSYSNTTRRS